MAVKFLSTLAAVLAFAVAAYAAAPPSFTIQGRVYCDTCRAGFETNVTEYIEGAKVGVGCRQLDSEEIHHQAEAVTDETGTYTVNVENDHQEEICEVALLESPRPDCREVSNGRDRGRVLLTQESGMSTDIRYANPLGYLKDEPLHECGEILKQYIITDDN